MSTRASGHDRPLGSNRSDGGDRLSSCVQAIVSPDGTGEDLLMLYVSIPFCRSKCAFCDYVQPIPPADLLLTSSNTTRQRYIDALCGEIRARGEALAKRYVPCVIYWGGGTASILEEHELADVMAALRDSFDLSRVTEATIECSPDTVDPVKLRAFRELGFNRFSVGIQSFNDQRLRKLGRRHTASEARRAVRWARDAGFDNVNVDIMCGFPDETLIEVRNTVSEALELKPDHLSLYPFRPTPGTALRRLIDADSKNLYLTEQKIAFQEGRRMIAGVGYVEYASGYFGRASSFVLNYFQLSASMVGFGSGAMSIFEGRFRTHMNGRLHDYIARPMHYDVDLPASADPVAIASLRAGLSASDGIPRDNWEHATGSILADVLERPMIAPLAQYLRARGLIEDARGLRLPYDEIGNVLIELTFRLLRPPARVRNPQPS